MCKYPRKIWNPRYKPSKKNGGHPEPHYDDRVEYIEIPCGKCTECRKEKADGWRVRLQEHFKENHKCTFFTMTISPERMKELKKLTGCEDENDNRIFIYEFRLFKERLRAQLNRWDKKAKIDHWVITERGGGHEYTGKDGQKHKGQERLHAHGIFFCPKNMSIRDFNKLLYEKWTAGFSFYGRYVSEKTINYVCKYMTKYDWKHPDFYGRTLASPGLGKCFIEKNRKYYQYKKGKTRQTWRDNKGFMHKLPTYYKQKLWNDKTREAIMIDNLEKGEKKIGNWKFNTTNSKSIQEANNYMHERMQNEIYLTGKDIRKEWILCKNKKPALNWAQARHIVIQSLNGNDTISVPPEEVLKLNELSS